MPGPSAAKTCRTPFFFGPPPSRGAVPLRGSGETMAFFKFLAVAPPNEGRAGGEPRGPQRCPKSPAATTEEILTNILFYTTTFSPTLSGFGHWGGLCPGGLRAAPPAELAFLALGRVYVAHVLIPRVPMQEAVSEAAIRCLSPRVLLLLNVSPSSRAKGCELPRTRTVTFTLSTPPNRSSRPSPPHSHLAARPPAGNPASPHARHPREPASRPHLARLGRLNDLAPPTSPPSPQPHPAGS